MPKILHIVSLITCSEYTLFDATKTASRSLPKKLLYWQDRMPVEV